MAVLTDVHRDEKLQKFGYIFALTFSQCEGPGHSVITTQVHTTAQIELPRLRLRCLSIVYEALHLQGKQSIQCGNTESIERVTFTDQYTTTQQGQETSIDTHHCKRQCLQVQFPGEEDVYRLLNV